MGEILDGFRKIPLGHASDSAIDISIRVSGIDRYGLREILHRPIHATVHPGDSTVVECAPVFRCDGEDPV